MNPDLQPSNPGPSEMKVERRYEKVILRLVKGGPERLAIEASQIDAVVDPASGRAILLPDAQWALIERKARYRGLVGLSSDWYWEQDEHYRFISRVDVTDRKGEFEDEDIVGKTLWELPIDSVSDSEWDTHRRQLEWRATFRDLEVRRVDGTGHIRWLSFSGEPIIDDREQFKGYHGITRDITERKWAEALVRGQDRFAGATLDALASQVGVLDQDGAVLSANKAWLDCAGVAVGANYLAACDSAGGMDGVDAVAIAAGIRQVIAGERKHFAYDHACSSPARWFALSVMGAEAGGMARAIVSREDITERRRGERLLALEYTVARCLADADDACAGLTGVIRAVCETQGWDCGRYFRLDPTKDLLCFDASWGVPVDAVRQFLEKSRSVVVRPGAGLKGRVYQSGQPLWILGGTHDVGASSAALAPETGGEGAFVFPVTSKEKTIGVLAFSSRTISAPDAGMLQAVRSIGDQLGRFLEREQAAVALRRSEARFRRLTDLSSDWYWELDQNFRFTQSVGCGLPGAGEVLGKTRWELTNIVLSEARWAEHKAHLSERWSFCDFEFAAVHPDGQLSYYSISGEPVYDQAGTFTGYCGTGLDITTRKRAELAAKNI